MKNDPEIKARRDLLAEYLRLRRKMITVNSTIADPIVKYLRHTILERQDKIIQSLDGRVVSSRSIPPE